MHLNLCLKTDKIIIIKQTPNADDDVLKIDESVMKECTVSPSEEPKNKQKKLWFQKSLANI